MVAVPSTHPGEELLEILNELNISVETFAQTTGISVALVNRIVRAQHSITPDIAVKIAKELDMTPESWLHLQSLHNEDMKREADSEVLPISKAVGD